MKSCPLKLALVTRRYPPLIGGAEKVLSYLADALAAEGADVTVVTSRMPGLALAAQEEEPITSSKNARLKRHGLFRSAEHCAPGDLKAAVLGNLALYA